MLIYRQPSICQGHVRRDAADATRGRSRLARPRMDGIEYLLWRQTLADGHATTVYAVRHPRRPPACASRTSPRRSGSTSGARRTTSTRRSSAGSSCGIPTGRSASSGSAAARSDEPVARLRGGAGLRGRLRGRGRPRAARAARPSRRATSSRPGPSSSATARSSSTGATSEGFSSGCGQFDSDITEGRHPRAALGLVGRGTVAVACDGRRSRVDGGLDLARAGEVMLELGAHTAINLDGGGSTTLVHRGISSTAPTRRRTSRLPSRGPSSALCSSSRAAELSADRRRCVRPPALGSSSWQSWAATPAHGRERGGSRGGHERRARHDRRAGRLVHRRRLHRRRRGADTGDTSHGEPRPLHAGRAHGVAHPPERADDLRPRGRRPRASGAAARSR